MPTKTYIEPTRTASSNMDVTPSATSHHGVFSPATDVLQEPLNRRALLRTLCGVVAVAVVLPLVGCGGGGGGTQVPTVPRPTGNRAYYGGITDNYGTFSIAGAPLGSLFLNSPLKIVRPGEGTYEYLSDSERYFLTAFLPESASKNHEFYSDYAERPDQWHSGTADIRFYFTYPASGQIDLLIYRRDRTVLGRAVGKNRGSGFTFEPLADSFPTAALSQASAPQKGSRDTQIDITIIISGDDNTTYTNTPPTDHVSITELKANERRRMNTLRSDPSSNLIFNALGHLSVAGLSEALGISSAYAAGAQQLIAAWAATNGLSRDPLANIDHSLISLGTDAQGRGIAYEPLV